MGNGGWAGAVVVSYCDRATITNNRIRNNDGEGLISLRSNYATISDNEISDSFSVELYIDNARFVTATRNLIYSTGNARYFRNGYPAAGIAVANETNTIMNPASDNVFSNNIVVGTRWGFYYGSFETGGGLRNTQVVNNTFYGTKQAILEIDDDTHANSLVENNIFYSVGTPAPSHAGTNGIAYRNNLWYGTTSGAAAGAADVFANPMFANAGGLTAADYKIKLGSAAIGTALDATSLVGTDYFGARRAQPFDIGAHQLSTGAIADLLAPTVPANLRAAGGNADSVHLNWNPATDNVGVTGYTVVRNGVAIATTATPTWIDTTVAEETVYAYQVQAVDAAGNRSALSEVLSVAWSSSKAISDVIAPQRPARVTAGATSTTTASIAWTAATDNVGVVAYEVYRDNVRIGTVGTLSFDDSGLNAGTAYAYYIVAVDAAGNKSERSNKVSVSMSGANRARAARR
jgi:parallel beta-helix repeat protein